MNVLEKHVLDLIGENVDAPDVFQDTDEGLWPIRESINDAIEEITILTGSYKEKYVIPLVSDQGFYRIRLNRGSLAWITDAWLVNNQSRLTQTDFIPLSDMNPRWMTNTGRPESYIPIGDDVLCLWPIPGGNELLELTIVVSPERNSASNDRIRLRDTFKWAAVNYAVGEYYASRGEAKEATNWHSKYMDELGLLGVFPKSQERNYQYGKN